MDYVEQLVVMDILRSEGWRILSFCSDKLVAQKGCAVLTIDFEWQYIMVGKRPIKAKSWGVIPILNAILS